MRILLAEDERDLNHIITRKLSSDGYSVDSCFDGEEAIDYLSCADYDAIILDIMMPKADGYTVLRQLRPVRKGHPRHLSYRSGCRLRPCKGVGQRRKRLLSQTIFL